MMLFDLKVQKWTELANVRVGGYHLWSGDSKYVYILDTTGNEVLVSYRVRIGDHKLERVADLKAPKALMNGLFGAWAGMTPDGSFLFLSNISSQEIYALELDLP